MKFTKEQAFESLKGILTNNGKKTLRLSDRTLNEQLETLIPLVSNDDMELTDFVDKTKSIFDTLNRNAEKEHSDFIKQWEKDHPHVDPKPKKEGEEEPSKEMKELMERIATLENENKEAKAKASIASKRSELVAKMKEKGIKDAEWIDSFLGEVSITEDMDVDAKADSFLKIYNKSNSKTTPNTTPLTSGGDGGEVNPIKAASDFAKARREAREALENQ